MDIYISTDMEGVGGVVSLEQVTPGRAEHALSARLQMGEINAAVEGALEGGAERIVVADLHWHGRNFPVDCLHPRAEYVTGSSSAKVRFPLLDDSFAGMLCIGYHARAGTQGAVLSHTMSFDAWRRFSVNGVEMGELGMDAAWAGLCGVPVLLVSGDQYVCTEARELLGEIETPQVKHALGRFRAAVVAPEVARARIKEAARRAVKLAEKKPFLPEPPYVIEVAFNRIELADGKSFDPGAERTDPFTIRYRGDDLNELMFRATG